MKIITEKFALVAIACLALSACGKSTSTPSSTPFVHTMAAGVYEKTTSDGSKDLLVVNQDDTMSLDLTRQVGGPGGISKEGVVPYETVCRVRESGVVTKESEETIEYEVRSVQLGDLTDLRNSEHCAEYVRIFNSMVPKRIRFSLKISDYSVRAQ